MFEKGSTGNFDHKAHDEDLGDICYWILAWCLHVQAGIFDYKAKDEDLHRWENGHTGVFDFKAQDEDLGKD